MKKAFAVLSVLSVLSLSLAAEAAPSRYCKASKKTTNRIEELRVVELPYRVAKQEIVASLATDKCVRSRLDNTEIKVLAEMLLDFNNNQDTAAQIIGEFMAQ